MFHHDATEVAYRNGFEAGQKAKVEQIFADIESAMRLCKTTHVGQEFYGLLLEQLVANIKKKYEVPKIERLYN